MGKNESSSAHDATSSALGFRYQERFALLELLDSTDDEASVAIEALDDIQLKANGVDLLEQLKHSFVTCPKPVGIKWESLWKTLRIWSEKLPQIDLSSTYFTLIAVAPLAEGSLLDCLEDKGSDRSVLLQALVDEANRVGEARKSAKSANKKLPYAKKYKGALAFLNLEEKDREALLANITLRPSAPKIDKLEEILATRLDTYPVNQRETLSQKLYEWWDRQVLLSFEGKRKRFIARHELIEQLSETSSMLQSEALMDNYSGKSPPSSFHTNEMLVRQCDLVGAKGAISKRARVSEWQARNQRSEWSKEAPSKHSKIVDYDSRLVLEWEYKHELACEKADDSDENSLMEEGFEVLRWSLEDAANEVGHIESTITSPFYVRGSYQVLSIEGRVGWHPFYLARLGLK